MASGIESYLRNFLGKQIYFHPNPGNAGDSLINAATFQLFRKLGLEYRLVHGDENLEGKIVLYGGGGNLVSYYNEAADFISKWHDRVEKMVLLPGSFDAHADLFNKLGPNVDIFCREKVSFEYVTGKAIRSGTYLCRDLAFEFDINQFWEWLSKNPDNFRGTMNRSLLTKLADERLVSGKALNSFRLDSESTDKPVPADNVDIARILEVGDMSEEASKVVAFKLLYFINQFDQINTNRLHVCIAGILLSKKVNFYPNSYFKNEAVYKYSIKNIYKNVTWNKPGFISFLSRLIADR